MPSMSVGYTKEDKEVQLITSAGVAVITTNNSDSQVRGTVRDQQRGIPCGNPSGDNDYNNILFFLSPISAPQGTKRTSSHSAVMELSKQSPSPLLVVSIMKNLLFFVFFFLFLMSLT